MPACNRETRPRRVRVICTRVGSGRETAAVDRLRTACALLFVLPDVRLAVCLCETARSRRGVLSVSVRDSFFTVCGSGQCVQM